MIKLNSRADLKEFMDCVIKISGTARAVQGATNVDARSTLGIASIMENGAFELRFIDCSESEPEMFSKWKA